MGEISVEKKLELVNQIRSRHRQNQSDLMNREQILYGRSTPMRNEYPSHREYSLGGEYRIADSNLKEDTEGIVSDDSFKLRFTLAAALFITLILLDISGKSFAGISTKQMFQMIETDYEEAIDAWVENVTLENSLEVTENEAVVK
ncbi:MAG: hypothetical protein IJF07_05660 [Lachnospiraceae bacterium]|nr:hypothetical protein [Lachnospiraceae bacterium]